MNIYHIIKNEIECEPLFQHATVDQTSHLCRTLIPGCVFAACVAVGYARQIFLGIRTNGKYTRVGVIFNPQTGRINSIKPII